MDDRFIHRRTTISARRLPDHETAPTTLLVHLLATTQRQRDDDLRDLVAHLSHHHGPLGAMRAMVLCPAPTGPTDEAAWSELVTQLLAHGAVVVELPAWTGAHPAITAQVRTTSPAQLVVRY